MKFPNTNASYNEIPTSLCREVYIVKQKELACWFGRSSVRPPYFAIASHLSRCQRSRSLIIICAFGQFSLTFFFAYVNRRLKYAIVLLSDLQTHVVRRQLFTFSTSPLKPLNAIQRNLTGSKTSTPSSKFVFFGLIGKTRWLPRPLIG